MFGIPDDVSGNHRVFAPFEIKPDIHGAFHDIAGHDDTDHTDSPDAAISGRGIFDIVVAEPQIAGPELRTPFILTPELNSVFCAVQNRILHRPDIGAIRLHDSRMGGTDRTVADLGVIDMIEINSECFGVGNKHTFDNDVFRPQKIKSVRLLLSGVNRKIGESGIASSLENKFPGRR